MLGFSKLIRVWSIASFQTGFLRSRGICVGRNKMVTYFKNLKNLMDIKSLPVIQLHTQIKKLAFLDLTRNCIKSKG